MPDDAIRIVIVDDHAMVRAGLRRLLDVVPDFSVVGEAADGAAGVALVQGELPHIVLMDMSMPVMDGVAATRRISELAPEVAVLMLTSFAQHEDVLRALDAGAAGYVLKDCEPNELFAAIRATVAGDAPLDPRAARALLADRRRRDQVALSGREREVLEAVGRGLANKLIARELSISEKTVKAHLTRVYAAIGVTDRTQAALWVERNGDRLG